MHIRSRYGALFTSVGAAIFLAAPLPASTIFHIFTGSESFAIGPCNGSDTFGLGTTLSSSSPVSASVACSGVTGTLASAAVSSEGHLGASLTMNTSPSGPGGSQADFSTLVVFSSTDPNASQDPISIALNLDILGFLSIAGSADTSWLATVQLGSTPYSYGRSIDGTVAGNGLFFSSGGESLTVNSLDLVGGVLTTPTISGVGLNTPIFLKITLTLEGFANPGTVDDGFLGSLDFPVGSDVFTLPDGYTANDPDVFLENNRFTPQSGSVPEPATWFPLGAALALLGGAGRRRLLYPVLSRR